MSVFSCSSSFMSRSRSLGYLARSSVGPNCMGLTKMLTTVTSASSRAFLTSARCPSCRYPMVGTKPIRFSFRSSSAVSCIWLTVSMTLISMERMGVVRERPALHLFNVLFDPFFSLSPDIHVALDEFRPELAEQTEQVVKHEHLAVTIRPGACACDRYR